MVEDLDPQEFEQTARAVVAACAETSDPGRRGQLLAEAGLLGVIAPETVGGLALPIRFAVPAVQAAGAGLLGYPLIEAMLLARHLAPVAPELASAIAGGRILATIAWTGLAEDGTVAGAPMGDSAALVLVFGADGGAGLVGHEAGLRGLAAVGLDVDLPDCTLALGGAVLRPVLDAAGVAALRADAVVLRAGFILGSAAQCLSLSTDYAQERVQFGKPLSANQVLRHRLARDAMAVQVLRAGLTRALAEPVDGVTNGIEQGGAGARHVGVEVERHNLGNRHGVVNDQLFVVELVQGQAHQAGGLLLGFEKGVEAIDGGFADGFHGAGAIQHEGDFRQGLIHDRWIGF